MDDVDHLFRDFTDVHPSAVPQVRGLASGKDLPVIFIATPAFVQRLHRHDPLLLGSLSLVAIEEPAGHEVDAILRSVAHRTLPDVHPQVIRALLERVLTAGHGAERAQPGLGVDLLQQLAAVIQHEPPGDGSEQTLMRALDAILADADTITTGVYSDAGRSRSPSNVTSREVVDAVQEHVFGHDEAIDTIARRVTASMSGALLRRERPHAVFLLAGPTGTGKTQIATSLASALYGHQNQIIRLDMSEYYDYHAISTLLGAPPGYKDSDPENNNWLTTRIAAMPNAVLLLDEIEKADRRVWDPFLQLFDAGRLTDLRGTTVSGAGLTVIMTTNCGAEAYAKKSVGFDGQLTDPRPSVMKSLKDMFRPEFLNRVDDTLVLQPLQKSTVDRIVADRLIQATSRLRGLGWDLSLDPNVARHLADAGFDTERGARPLLRVIENSIMIPAADLAHGAYDVRMAHGRAEFIRTGDAAPAPHPPRRSPTPVLQF